MVKLLIFIFLASCSRGKVKQAPVDTCVFWRCDGISKKWSWYSCTYCEECEPFLRIGPFQEQCKK